MNAEIVQLPLPAPTAEVGNAEAMSRISLALVALVESGDSSSFLAPLEGDLEKSANLTAAIDRLIRLLQVLRKDAEKLVVDALPKNKAGHAQEITELEGLLVRRVPHGGGLTGVDYKGALRDLVRAWLAANDGELSLELVETIESCFSFSGLKSNAKEKTGLVAWGLNRKNYGTEVPRTYGVKLEGWQ